MSGIIWKDLNFRRSSGEERIVCPYCSPERKKQNAKDLAVNHDKGVAHCHHCGRTGSREPYKEYNLPPQGWENHTALSDALVKWFESRGIYQKTLQECKISEERAYIPAHQREMNCISFNYFYKGQLVNKKYRSADKHFTQIKGARKVFYGIDDLTEDTAYIVEGEMDKLSMWQVGIKNCISVPNGANDLTEVFENCDTSHIKNWIIAVDMDDKGKDLEHELLKRFGRHNCKRVNFIGKDANEDLQAGYLLKSISKATEYPVEGSVTAEDYQSDILHYIKTGPRKPLMSGIEGMDEFFNTLPGQFNLITGIPGHGKSNWLEWYILNMCLHNNHKVAFFTPEHGSTSDHLVTLLEKVVGKTADPKYQSHMTETEAMQGIAWLKNHVRHLEYKGEGRPTAEWILKKFSEHVKVYGTEHFVIDAFNKMGVEVGNLSSIAAVLSDLALFCQQHQVSVWLVAHPTKMRKKDKSDYYEVPGLYDVKYSGDFADQIHNALTVYRDFENGGLTRVHVLKKKMRHQAGQVGLATTFEWEGGSGRFKHSHQNNTGGSFIQAKQKSVFDEPEEPLFEGGHEGDLPF